MAAAAIATATASPIRRPPRNVRMICFSPIIGKRAGCERWLSRLQFRLLPHDHLGAPRDALVEGGHVGVDQPEATRGGGGADGVRPLGAVNALGGGPEIHCAGADRTAGAAGHEA